MKTTNNATTCTTRSTSTTRSTKLFACGAALALALAAGSIAAAATPSTALANDGMGVPNPPAAAAQYQGHFEGQQVTIGDDWGQPVYAEWHQGDSGQWWATFWTYNGTYVYAQPAPAGCGWSFHVYDKDGNFTTVYRTNESTDFGVVGPKGISSHWQDDRGYWY